MARYAPTTSELEGKNFFAGVEFPHITGKKTASAAIAKYSPVVLNDDGKLQAVTATKDDSSDTYTTNTTGLYGITLEDIANDEEGAVLLTGEVLSSALVLGDNVSAAALEVPFRNIGIFLK